jgi:DNA adenine methylase
MIGPLPWVGGKNRLARHIIDLIPKHKCYIEPFAGGAQVYFHKQPSEVEVLNDLDGEIVNFYRICQYHHQELIRYLQFCVMSRQWYDLLQATDPKTLTDIQKAARFYYLQKNSFAGLVVKQNYHYAVVQRPNYNLTKIPEIIASTHERLARAQVECLPYEDILLKYDRTDSFFYIDPPYFQRRLYRFNFADEDFEKLRRCLLRLKGRFILSLDDHPEVRRLFGQWRIETVDLHYTSQRAAGRRYKELLIMNFSSGKSKSE